MPQPLERLRTHLRDHRAKWSAGLILLTLGMLLWGRLLLKNVPRTAVARPDATAAIRSAPACQQSPAPVQRDWPATLDHSLFAPPWTANSSDAQETFSSQTAKSAEFQADNTERTEALRRSLASLRLQTTILGPAPRAVIDGRLLAPGDPLQGWLVREIHARHVILEKDGVRLRLDMQP